MAATTRAAQNEDLVRRFAQAVVNEGDYDRIDEFVAEDVRDHTPLGQREGRDVMVETTRELRTAFPDFEVTLEEVVGDGDTVAVRMRQTGTHDGPFMGIEPTGASFEIEAMAFLRVGDGKIVERRTQPDVLALLGQLGITKLPAKAS